MSTYQVSLHATYVFMATAYHRAQNRQAWSKLVRTATSSSGQATWWWWPNSRQLEIVEGYQRVAISPWPVLGPSHGVALRHETLIVGATSDTESSNNGDVTSRSRQRRSWSRRSRAAAGHGWQTAQRQTAASLDRDRRGKRRRPTERNPGVD